LAEFSEGARKMMRCAGFGQIIPTSRLHASSSRRIRVEAQPVDARSPSRSMHAFARRATVRVDPATMVAERKALLWRWRIGVDAHPVHARAPSRSMHAYEGVATFREDPATTTMVAERKAILWRYHAPPCALLFSFNLFTMPGEATIPGVGGAALVEWDAFF